jgi:hypothetical protein
VQELVPIFGGVAVGVLLAGLRPRHLAPGLVAAVSLAIGVAASFVSGEIEVSPAFVLWDTTQCVLAAVATGACVEGARRSREP